jgi:hypothetical protein
LKDGFGRFERRETAGRHVHNADNGGNSDGGVGHGNRTRRDNRRNCACGRCCTTDIYIGCSGNFTIERVLKGVTDAKLHGNDVTIYSCLLGDYFAGVPLKAKFNEQYDGPMTFLRDYMKTDLDTITVVMLLSKMSVYLGSKPNPYYIKMIDAYKDRWTTIFEQTKSKVEKAGAFLSSFYAGDVCGWVDEVPKEQGFICYPPFYSGDYEKMFRLLSKLSTGNRPTMR